MIMEEANYEFPLPVRYHLTAPKGKGLVIVLHGYQDTAHSMMKRLGWLDTELPFQVLAINAPFPVPIWNKEGLKEAYSWYFRDRDKDLVIVAPDTTAERVAQLFRDLQLENSRKVFFGYSQGGYLAPYIAAHSDKVRGIAGLGCGFNEDAFENLNPLPVLALHGALDDRVSIDKSKKEHEALIAQGFTGEFIEIPGLEHKVDPVVEPLVRDFILKNLADRPSDA